MSREYYIYNPKELINRATRGIEQSVAQGTSGIGELLGDAIKTKAANEELNKRNNETFLSNTMKSLTNHIKSGVIRSGVFENVLALNTDEDVLLNLNPDQLRQRIDEVINNHIDYETPSISFLHTNRGMQIDSDNIETETERDGKFDYEYKNTNKGFS